MTLSPTVRHAVVASGVALCLLTGAAAALPAGAAPSPTAPAARTAAVGPLGAELLSAADKVGLTWTGDQSGSKDQNWGSGGTYHYVLKPVSGQATPDVDWKVRFTLPEGQAFDSEYQQDQVTVAGSTLTVAPSQDWRRKVPQNGLEIIIAWKEDPSPIAAVPGKPDAPATWAPYVDTSLYPEPDLPRIGEVSGTRQFTTAFIVSDAQDRKTPVWGGQHAHPVSGNYGVPRINELRRAGGDVVVSFGGENNNELAQDITDVGALTEAYGGVVERLKAYKLDFDIEGTAVVDKAANTRRAKALAALQQRYATKGTPLHISYTLPVLASGLTPDGMEVVRDALRNGLAVETWNVMAMDYGPPVQDMGQAAIDAGTNLHDQLASVYPGTPDAAVWKMIGVTPMIGVNDSPGETFRLEDARRLAAWASQKHIGRLAMWSATRDHPCDKPTASPVCSGIPGQQEYEYSKALGTFTG
ncbi:glycoside hydrolase family 18 protein [Streptomyces sp. CA-181903]|uniref:glycoside hydrolase family 18 protein n=1 Tax=Streptomyces sp. CA-181903 TaxID=3240055 RepID=UPI003D8A280A